MPISLTATCTGPTQRGHQVTVAGDGPHSTHSPSHSACKTKHVLHTHPKTCTQLLLPHLHLTPLFHTPQLLTLIPYTPPQLLIPSITPLYLTSPSPLTSHLITHTFIPHLSHSPSPLTSHIHPSTQPHPHLTPVNPLIPQPSPHTHPHPPHPTPHSTLLSRVMVSLMAS